ncbi:MAG: sigma factor [Candidatus Kapaibacterium sp.]|jgi:DNA-directed RNA polymerase specialized sigma subunit
MIIYGKQVREVLTKLKTPKFLWEDCFSEGLLYAVIAAKKYDKTKGSLNNWIKICVFHNMKRYLNNEKTARGIEI